MTHLKWDIKLGPITLIIISVLLLVFVSVFSYYKFADINEEYTSKMNELNKLKDELDRVKLELNTTSSELELKKERELGLSQQYDTVLSSKNDLQLELENIIEDKENLQIELDSLKREVGSLNLKLIEIEGQLTDKENFLFQAYLRLDCYEVTYPDATC